MSNKSCFSCGFENPAEHLFCENCGVSLSDSIIAPVYINTLKHDSQLISLNVFYRRVWYWFLTLVASGLSFWLFPDIHVTYWTLGVGLFISFVVPYRYDSIIRQPIPTEILSKNIIAYGPSYKRGCFFFASGLMYFLDDGFFYKSYSIKGDTYFLFIEKSSIDFISSHDRLPIGRSSSKISIHTKNGAVHQFNVYKRELWLLTFYQFGLKILAANMSFAIPEAPQQGAHED
jgi:hypothetical protein